MSNHHTTRAKFDTRIQTVQSLFVEADAPPPFFEWNPNPANVENTLLRQFSEVCDKLSHGNPAIPDTSLDLGAFGGMTDWIMLLSVSETEMTYRYDHYGRGISRVYGRDMTGHTTDEFPGHIGQFFSVIYAAVQARNERIMTVHQPPNRVFVSTWRRLIVPVVNSDGGVVRFLALNLPENELRAGLEVLPVPVLILDSNNIVCYANKQARQQFDGGAFGPWSRNLFDYAALDLEIRESPKEILDNGMVQTSQCRHIKHTQIGEYEATISAALHHDVAFYVVLLQNRSH